MTKTLVLTTGAAIVAAMLAIAPASAAPLAPLTLPGVSADGGIVKVHVNRCRAWRNECAHRWGWGGFRYRRCLALHGC